MPTIHMDTGFVEKPCNVIIYVDRQYLSSLVEYNLGIRDVHTNIQIPLLKSSRPLIKHLNDIKTIPTRSTAKPGIGSLILVLFCHIQLFNRQ